VFVAMDVPLDGDAHLRERMAVAERRAERQAGRYPGLDLPSLQRGVHRNLRSMLLELDGRFTDLLDLMNYIRNGRRHVALTPRNAASHHTLATSATLNGIYMFQFLRAAGFDPLIVQNYALAELPDVLDGSPLAVCLSSNFVLMEDIKRMAREIKARDPEIPVVAGGMLAKKVLEEGEGLSPEALGYLETFHGLVDAFVVEAQGEQTLVRLLRALREGRGLEGIPNLARFDSDGRMRFSARQPEDLHMDGTAVAWDEIPRELLRPTLPVTTSRGCAYRCRFCTYHWLFPRVVFKSLEVLRDELRRIARLGFVRHIRFTDDNFTANRRRLVAVLEMMIREGFPFTWSSFARASALDPELVELMRRAGCEFVDMGIESGSRVVLENMDKRLVRDQSLAAIRMLNDQGITGRGSFIVGYPGETEVTFLETVDLIRESRLPYYHPYLFYYSRNTLVHREREAFGLEGLGLAWRHDTMDSVEASELMARMPRLVEPGLTDGQTYIEEIYKLLRGKGYARETIRELFQLKREMVIAPDLSDPAARAALDRVESLVARQEGVEPPAHPQAGSLQASSKNPSSI
jgi:p-methyltransferase